jgi:DNA-binding transcriptional regulator YbjK
MAEPQSATTRKRSSRGEQTRTRILEAAMETIAELGLRGVTHREVARRASVQLSLTTYYFRDIEELIREAFVLFSARSRPNYETVWAEVFAYLESFPRSELRKVAVKRLVCDGLAQRATDYLVSRVMENPVGLAVEQTLFTAARQTPELRQLADAHRANLLRPLMDFCSYFNREDPEVDAELLLDVMTTLEYATLPSVEESLDPGRLLTLIRRQIGWIMGVRRA